MSIKGLYSGLDVLLSNAEFDRDKFCFVAKLDDETYKVLQNEGLEVKEQVSVRKYKKELDTGFRPSDITTRDGKERVFKTNVSLVRILEREFSEYEEHSGYGSTKDVSERCVEIGRGSGAINTLRADCNFLLHNEIIINKIGLKKTGVKLHLYEKKADGYPDEYIDILVNDETMFNYSNSSLTDSTKPFDDHLNMNRIKGFEKGVATLKGDEPFFSPFVRFTIPNKYSDDRYEQITLYWFEKLNSWAAIGKTAYLEHDHENPRAESYQGPYNVNSHLARFLLEAYGVDKKAVSGRDVSKIPPSELEKMAKGE